MEIHHQLVGFHSIMARAHSKRMAAILAEFERRGGARERPKQSGLRWKLTPSREVAARSRYSAPQQRAPQPVRAESAASDRKFAEWSEDLEQRARRARIAQSSH